MSRCGGASQGSILPFPAVTHAHRTRINVCTYGPTRVITCAADTTTLTLVIEVLQVINA